MMSQMNNRTRSTTRRKHNDKNKSSSSTADTGPLRNLDMNVMANNNAFSAGVNSHHVEKKKILNGISTGVPKRGSRRIRKVSSSSSSPRQSINKSASSSPNPTVSILKKQTNHDFSPSSWCRLRPLLLSCKPKHAPAIDNNNKENNSNKEKSLSPNHDTCKDILKETQYQRQRQEKEMKQLIQLHQQQRRSATTKRVQFDLHGNQIIYFTAATTNYTKSYYNNMSIPQVKGFMKRVLFSPSITSTSSSTTSSNMSMNADTSPSTTKNLNNSCMITSSLYEKDSANDCDNKNEENFNNNDNNAKSENKSITDEIDSIFSKGKTAQYTTHQYPNACKYYLETLAKLDKYSYPSHHPLRTAAISHLNDTYHCMRTLEHSSDIVKMGLKHETQQEHMKALKKYTIAFHIRKNTLGPNHYSLPILLNMIGSIQIKRGEWKEAKEIFELALYGRLEKDTMTIAGKTNVRLSTKAVSMREMGKICELSGRGDCDDEALDWYHDSLDCILVKHCHHRRYGGSHSHSNDTENNDLICKKETFNMIQDNINDDNIILMQSCNVRLVNDMTKNVNDLSSSSSRTTTMRKQPKHIIPSEEMEVYLESKSFGGKRTTTNLSAFYDTFFQNRQIIASKNISVHVAMTLHQIANIHCKRRHYTLALATYNSSLRGMRVALGNKHPNVAAVLGNIGNIYKEMKEFDLAYAIYQDVLKIELQNLGFGHPEIIVSMHNIAMIEKCRGNYKKSIELYREVLSVQLSRQERSMKWFHSTAVTYTCLGDVEERDGNILAAISAYKDALSTRTQYIDKLHPDLGKLLHKIGCLNTIRGNYRDAAIFYAKALRLYEFNNITDSRVMIILRDQADVLGKIAFNTSTV